MDKRDMEVAAIAWDAAIASVRYEDGTRPDIVSAANPYKQALEAGLWFRPDAIDSVARARLSGENKESK